MINKIGRVSNPLTIIAIFAGLAEIGGTIVLPSLNDNNQSVFIWFVMLFPTLLVILFFIVLIWRNEVLYAPGDYQDDNTFVEMSRGIKVSNNQSKEGRFSINVEKNIDN